jgi:hypothetical protein
VDACCSRENTCTAYISVAIVSNFMKERAGHVPWQKQHPESAVVAAVVAFLLLLLLLGCWVGSEDDSEEERRPASSSSSLRTAGLRGGSGTVTLAFPFPLSDFVDGAGCGG